MVKAQCSKRCSPGGLGHQVQIAGIGGVAAQPEPLALPGRRHLPWRGILQGRDECAAVRWRYLQRHFDQPGVDRRKRQFFGIKNAGAAWLPPVAAGQGLSRGLGREYRRCRHCRHGNGEFHIAFPCAADANTRDDRDEIAWSATQNQDACRRRSNRNPAGMKKHFSKTKYQAGVWDRPQSRLRVRHASRMKTAINPAAISIQYWPSKPKNTKRLMRNCTVPVPNFGQNKRFVCAR